VFIYASLQIGDSVSSLVMLCFSKVRTTPKDPKPVGRTGCARSPQDSVPKRCLECAEYPLGGRVGLFFDLVRFLDFWNYDSGSALARPQLPKVRYWRRLARKKESYRDSLRSVGNWNRSFELLLRRFHVRNIQWDRPTFQRRPATDALRWSGL